ncbi:Plug domain-containing protein [Aliifodinibius sp. S!AR15-10]|uniref:Plug domain-containing protein n=1 Tax=Aliifodinibius sp. S!AR15-10 TaxID=2950437 RepID=UPI00285F079B|nr:Plug domain-containing protein [Aliifodinibius sp. S!AR15-10]MDR8392440.1 Plug domain-containing protein [Aliifodinibius sp. S!AR15-10]
MTCKEAYRYFLSIACTLLILGCGTSGNGVSSSSAGSTGTSNKIIVDNPTLDLTDYLRRVPGVSVAGSGPNAFITIRGINTLLGNPSPLFVVNGVRVGRNFSNVYNLVNLHDVSNIEVLKGADAAFYGVEGGGGIIVINSKM